MIQSITEIVVAGNVPRLSHPGWSRSFPWLSQGITYRGGAEPFDLGLFGPSPSRDVQKRWDRLSDSVGSGGLVHGRQVHGVRISVHDVAVPGRTVVASCDGHATALPGILLTVASADCVPISIVDPEARSIALLHAGWRGIAAGILHRGVATLKATFGSEPARLHAHFGPAICGSCYEVGPEVHEALDMPEPEGPTPVDLRDAIARRALDEGIPPQQLSKSTLCTRCGQVDLFSHRGGDTGRQLSYLGIVAAGVS